MFLSYLDASIKYATTLLYQIFLLNIIRTVLTLDTSQQCSLSHVSDVYFSVSCSMDENSSSFFFFWVKENSLSITQLFQIITNYYYMFVFKMRICFLRFLFAEIGRKIFRLNNCYIL